MTVAAGASHWTLRLSSVPSTVADIFASAGAKPGGVVRWGQVPARPPRKNASTTGIYVVALTDAVYRVEGTRPKAPIALPLRKLIERRPELRLDDVPNPTAQQLRKRLGQFGFPDEIVLYIGLADARRRSTGPPPSPDGR